MSSESWLAIQFPHLALDLLTRSQAGRQELPMAVSDGLVQRPAVLDCNPSATRHGIRPGQAISAAVGLCEGLVICERDIPAEQQALQRLAAWCYQYSSQVSLEASRNCLLLEAGASQRLYGEPAELAGQLAIDLQKLGYLARTGTAPTPEAAQLAAKLGTHMGSMADIRAQLRDLPLEHLYLESNQHHALAKMGFHNTGAILRLPRKALARRLGPAVIEYLDRLTGARPDPRTAWQPPGQFSSGMDLPAEITQSQALLFPLRRLVDELCGVLRAADCGIQAFKISFQLRKGEDSIKLNLQSPAREAGHLMLLLRERLERLRLLQPVHHIRLEAGEFFPFESAQHGLFEDDAQSGGQVEPLLERLAARLGGEAVRGLAGVQDHRPEHSWSLREVGSPVRCEAMPHRPVWLYPRAQPCRIENYRVLAGPERIESGWWDGADCRRDYFVVRDERGSTLWAYREYKPGDGWFLQGVFA